jgi:CRP/FNR family transcriptional regulator, anaerobic regulatory protein
MINDTMVTAEAARQKVIRAVRPAAGERSSMADLLHLMGVPVHDHHSAASIPVVLRRVASGQALYHEGAEAVSIYFVRTGTIKTSRTAEDGYEQVLGFLGRSEVVGFDAVCIGHHPTAAVALEDSTLYAVPVQDVFSLGQRLPELDRALYLAVSSQLMRRDDLAELMAPVAAEVRLARFLVQVSRKMAAAGQSPSRFHLRMSRREIARYLGVAHETVSRSFGALAQMGCVHADNREVQILDLERLRAFARSTRRQHDDAVACSHTHRPSVAVGSAPTQALHR